MKKLFAKLSIYLIAITATLLMTFPVVQALAPVTGGLVGSIRIKNQILKATPSPKIIIAAGSSAPYCFIGSKISNALDMNYVNMGATAYLGAEFYLNAIQPEIKSGDIIILAFEFNVYTGSFAAEILLSAVKNDWSLIEKLPISYIPKLVSNYIPYAYNKLSTYYLDGRKHETDKEYFDDFGFTAQGDILTHRELILEKGYNTLDLHNINQDIIDENTTKAIKRFAKKAQAKGASVYITAAPINELSLQSSVDDIAAFQEKLALQTGVQIIGDMRNGVMKSELFFDSNFHLNSKGAEIYTARFIKEMKAVLNK